MRVLYMKKVISVSDYEKAEELLAVKEDNTCECCFHQSKTKYSRKIHEQTTHVQCCSCLKSFTDSSVLKAHIDSLHPVESFSGFSLLKENFITSASSASLSDPRSSTKGISLFLFKLFFVSSLTFDV